MSKEALENRIICQSCGRCCLEVGRTFWKHGNFRFPGNPFGDTEDLNQEALNGDHEDNGLPCEKLEITDGKAICTIHRDYGYAVKPIVCRDYPDGEPCFREKAFDEATGGRNAVDV